MVNFMTLKLKLREGKELVHMHTARKWRSPEVLSFSLSGRCSLLSL
jgi:hypothetical protein